MLGSSDMTWSDDILEESSCSSTISSVSLLAFLCSFCDDDDYKGDLNDDDDNNDNDTYNDEKKWITRNNIGNSDNNGNSNNDENWCQQQRGWRFICLFNDATQVVGKQLLPLTHLQG